MAVEKARAAAAAMVSPGTAGGVLSDNPSIMRRAQGDATWPCWRNQLGAGHGHRGLDEAGEARNEVTGHCVVPYRCTIT